MTGSLADLLLREGLVTDSQLKSALSIQQDTQKSLGRVLIEMGLITERVRLRLLQEKFGLEIVNINPQRLDRMILEYVPRSIASRHRLIPIRLELDTLVVAMEDPLDLAVADMLKSMTGFRIRPVAARIEDIDAALKVYPEEPEPVAVAKPIPTWVRILGDALFLGLLAAPFLVLLLYVPTNPTLLSQLAQRGFVDFFIFTLIGYGIYAVIVFEVWSLVFQRARTRGEQASPPPPSGSP